MNNVLGMARQKGISGLENQIEISLAWRMKIVLEILKEDEEEREAA